MPTAKNKTNKRNNKPAAKAAAKAAAAQQPTPQPEANKPIRHDTASAYTGASGLVRSRTASARVMLNRSVGKFTDRDHCFAGALVTAHGTDAFPGANYDAGAISRLIAHGRAVHVTGTGNTHAGYVTGASFKMLPVTKA